MDPGFLNNLYLAGTLLAAIFMIVWRLNAASQKLNAASQETVLQSINYLKLQIEAGVSNLQTEMAGVKDRLGKVENGLTVVDNRVRDLQIDTAVVKDRLNILIDDRPAPPVPARAGSPIQKVAAAEA